MVFLTYKAMSLAQPQNYLNIPTTAELFQVAAKALFIFSPYLPTHPYKLFSTQHIALDSCPQLTSRRDNHSFFMFKFYSLLKSNY